MDQSLYMHPSRKKRMGRPEQILQIAVFDFLKPLMVYKKYSDFICYHPPNGGKRTEAEARIFKAMGVMPGVPDIIFHFRGGKTAFVELKAGKKAQTDSQDGFQKCIEALGFEYVLLVAMDKADAVRQIVKFLNSHGVKT